MSEASPAPITTAPTGVVPMVGKARHRSDDRRSGTGARVETRYHRLQLVLGIVGLIAAAALVLISALNRSLQAEVAAGQARAANAQAAANVNNMLIRLLAKAAAEKNDEKIRNLLSRNGISFRQAAPESGAAPAAATPAN